MITFEHPVLSGLQYRQSLDAGCNSEQWIFIYAIVQLAKMLLQFRSVKQLLQRVTTPRNFSVANALFKLKAEQVTNDKQKQEIQISWQDNKVSRFPYVFLRDNCTCSSCFHPTSGQSLVLLENALKDAAAGIDTASINGQDVVLKWACGHESRFDLLWLEKRGFYEVAMKEKSQHPVSGLKRVVWGSEHAEKMKFLDFNDTVKNDDALYEWMKTLATEGLNVLKDTPKEPNQLKLLGNRASCGLLNTMYGDIFTVQDKPDANNLAYTTGYLAMHTDQPYYVNQPGVQFLHCIRSSIKNEGVNHLVDGFKVAYDFKDTYPEDFNVLTKLTLPYEQHGVDMFGEFLLKTDRPVIGLDRYGEVECISHNYPSRASTMNHSPEQTKIHYKALGRFVKMMYDPKYLVKYKLEAGDILCFNNRRVLHGRTAYDPSKANRWLEGGYLNMDDFYSRLRALKNALDQ